MNAWVHAASSRMLRGRKPSPEHVGLGPEVVAGQADVVPAERRDVSQEIVGNGGARASQMVRGAPEIDGVPVDDRRGDEIEAGRAIALVFERAIGETALLVQENGLIERMARLALVQTRHDIAAAVLGSPASRA